MLQPFNLSPHLDHTEMKRKKEMPLERKCTARWSSAAQRCRLVLRVIKLRNML